MSGPTCAKNNRFNAFVARQSTGGTGIGFPSSTSAPISPRPGPPPSTSRRDSNARRSSSHARRPHAFECRPMRPMCTNDSSHRAPSSSSRFVPSFLRPSTSLHARVRLTTTRRDDDDFAGDRPSDRSMPDGGSIDAEYFFASDSIDGIDRSIAGWVGLDRCHRVVRARGPRVRTPPFT